MTEDRLDRIERNIEALSQGLNQLTERVDQVTDRVDQVTSQLATASSMIVELVEIAKKQQVENQRIWEYLMAQIQSSSN